MKMRDRKRHIVRRFVLDEHGTSMIELAIVLPIFIILMASIAEFGRFFYTYTTLAKATRAGARYISAQPFGGNTYKNRTKNLVVCGKTNCSGETPVVKNLSTAQVKIDAYVCNPGCVLFDENAGINVPDMVEVRIDGYSYQPVIFNLGALIGSGTFSYPLKPSTTMQYLLTAPAMPPA